MARAPPPDHRRYNPFPPPPRRCQTGRCMICDNARRVQLATVIAPPEVGQTPPLGARPSRTPREHRSCAREIEQNGKKK